MKQRLASLCLLVCISVFSTCSSFADWPRFPQDTDYDHDSVPNYRFPENIPIDNCPDVFNPWQLDGDGNGIGAACDGPNDFYSEIPVREWDRDNDGYADHVDGCPGAVTTRYADPHHDYSVGTVLPCQDYQNSPPGSGHNDDDDGDGIKNSDDSNPGWDERLGVAFQYWHSGVNNNAAGIDRDLDGRNNDVDNCPDIWNPRYEGICTGDYDNDGILDADDPEPFETPRPVGPMSCPDTDELQSVIAQRDRQIQRLNGTINSITNQRNAIANERNDCLQEVESLGEEMANLRDTISRFREQRDSLKNDLTQLETENTELTEEIGRLNRQVDELNRRISRQSRLTLRLRSAITRLRNLVARLTD